MPRATLLVLLFALPALQACIVGTVVGVATDVAIEVVKVPFKVAGAVVDVATGDDEDEEKEDAKAAPVPAASPAPPPQH